MSGLPGPSVGLLPALCCADWLVSPPPLPTFGWAHRFVSLAPEDGVGGSPRWSGGLPRTEWGLSGWRGGSAGWSGGSPGWRGGSPGWSGSSLDGVGAPQDRKGASLGGEGAPQDRKGAALGGECSPGWRGGSPGWRGFPWMEWGLPWTEGGLPFRGRSVRCLLPSPSWGPPAGPPAWPGRLCPAAPWGGQRPSVCVPTPSHPHCRGTVCPRGHVPSLMDTRCKYIFVSGFTKAAALSSFPTESETWLVTGACGFSVLLPAGFLTAALGRARPTSLSLAARHSALVWAPPLTKLPGRKPASPTRLTTPGQYELGVVS